MSNADKGEYEENYLVQSQKNRDAKKSSLRYRIIKKVVDGKDRFYAQYKTLFFWRTIKTESQKLWCSDGGVQTKYTAEVWINNHKKSIM